MITTLEVKHLSGRQRYRLLTSLVVPRPIGWISTRSPDGLRNLAPFSYFNALSASPVLVGASVGRRRDGPKHTLTNIQARGEFVVNLVSERHLEAMVRTAGDWPAEVDEFEEAGLTPAEATTVDAPYVSDAAAVFECRLFPEVSLGDANTLVIGEVLTVHLGSALVVDADSLHVDVRSYRPVGRLGRDEYTLLGEVRHVPRPRVG